MIERGFERAQQLRDNKSAVRQFAITQARELLQAAGVVDPAIKDQIAATSKDQIAATSKDQIAATRPQKEAEQPFYIIPEGEDVRFSLDIGGKSVEQLEAEIKATGREVTIYASDMLHSPKFKVLEKVTPQELLKAPVRAFGLSGNPTTEQLLERIPQCRYGEYALELPRAEVGPHKAIDDKDQAKDDYYYVMHQPITARHGDLHVFEVAHNSNGRFLYGEWALPGIRWSPDCQLVVALRKIEPLKS